MKSTTQNLNEAPSVQLKPWRGLKKLCALILVEASAIASLGNVATVRGNADNRDSDATRVVEQFMAALVSKDIESVMKVVAVPFYLDARKNITTIEGLRKEFADAFVRGDPTKIKYSIGEVRPVSEALSSSGNPKPLNDKLGKLLAEVLAGDDRLVEVTMNSQGTQEKVIVLVSFRDDKVRVVGFRD